MTQELAKQLMCVKMRSGVEIWLEKDKAQKLSNLLGISQIKFVDIDGETINSASIEGIFTPERMEDLTRRKNGQWKCEPGNYWHNRGEECSHGRKFC